MGASSSPSASCTAGHNTDGHTANQTFASTLSTDPVAASPPSPNPAAVNPAAANPLFTSPSGFIFDCDGTLLDSMGAWNALEEELFATATTPFTEDQKNELRAVPIQDGAGIFHAHGVGSSPENVLEILDTKLLDFYRESAQALPGVAQFLQRAHQAGIPCSVVTSSPLRYVQAGLERNGLTGYFCQIVTTDGVGLSKQDERIYHLACEVMGSSIETTWAFDDALYAIRVMAACGLRTCACYDCDETGTFEDLAATAEIAIRSFEELL